MSDIQERRDAKYRDAVAAAKDEYDQVVPQLGKLLARCFALRAVILEGSLLTGDSVEERYKRELPRRKSRIIGMRKTGKGPEMPIYAEDTLED